MEILEPTGETQGPIARYPWPVWLELDGKPKVLDEHYDFKDANIENMRVYLYTKAKERGLLAKTNVIDGRYIVFQIYKDKDNPPRLPAFKPSNAKPKCRHCSKVLSKYSIPFGECRLDGKPNKRSCK